MGTGSGREWRQTIKRKRKRRGKKDRVGMTISGCKEEGFKDGNWRCKRERKDCESGQDIHVWIHRGTTHVRERH